jgi:O-succinylbenzoate synthase
MQLETRICLDEAIRNSRDAEAAIALGACGIINIKVGRMGGMSEAKAVHDVCQKNNIPVWCGGMLETGVGRAHNVHLSTLPNFTLPGDVSASKRYWREDIIEPEVSASSQGTITVPQVAGTGYRVKKDLVEKLTVRKESFSAVVGAAR